MFCFPFFETKKYALEQYCFFVLFIRVAVRPHEEERSLLMLSSKSNILSYISPQPPSLLTK